jgi:hypothetical protein
MVSEWYSVLPSVRLSTCISADATGRIYVKFDNGDMCNNLSIKPNLVENLKKIFGFLSEDLSTFTVTSDIKLP